MDLTGLPPGFRFCPSDTDLVVYYLKRKIMGKPFRFEIISEVDIYKYAPWDLPAKSCVKSNDLQWYFFCPREKKSANSSKAKRKTDIGFWKATGKDRAIVHNSKTVGTKTTLIFHIGKSRQCRRTDWVNHEYRLDGKALDSSEFAPDAYVVCKIYKKIGLGPKIGEQYVAPFTEEGWEDVRPSRVPDLVYNPCMHSPPDTVDSIMLQSVTQHSEVYEGDDLGSLLARILSTPPLGPLHLGSNDELTEPLDMYASSTKVPDVDTVGMCRELQDQCDTDELELDNNSRVPPDTVKESDFQPMMSELGEGFFMELNDIPLIRESDPSELFLTDDLFALNSFFQCPNFHDLNGSISLNSSTAITTVSSDSLPQRSDIFSGQFMPTPEMDGYGMSINDLSSIVCQMDEGSRCLSQESAGDEKLKDMPSNGRSGS